MAECVARYCRPEPRVRLGALLGRNRAASACMDLSDGLADGVAPDRRGQRRRRDRSTPARCRSIRRRAPGSRRAGGDPVDAALAGGDDYELLFAVRPPRRAAVSARSSAQARGVRADAHRRAAPRSRRSRCAATATVSNRCPPGSSTSDRFMLDPRAVRRWLDQLLHIARHAGADRGGVRARRVLRLLAVPRAPHAARASSSRSCST